MYVNEHLCIHVVRVLHKLVYQGVLLLCPFMGLRTPTAQLEGITPNTKGDGGSRHILDHGAMVRFQPSLRVVGGAMVFKALV